MSPATAVRQENPTQARPELAIEVLEASWNADWPGAAAFRPNDDLFMTTRR